MAGPSGYDNSSMGLRSLLQLSGTATVLQMDGKNITSASYCYCHLKDRPGPPPQMECRCGEWPQARLAWQWDCSPESQTTRTLIEESNALGQIVMFHPVYSAGTGVVRSERPLVAGSVNYFEVKVLTGLTGTDTVSGINETSQYIDIASHAVWRDLV